MWHFVAIVFEAENNHHRHENCARTGHDITARAPYRLDIKIDIKIRATAHEWFSERRVNRRSSL